MRSLKENLQGMIDLGVVLMIGIAFVGLIVIAYIIYQIRGSLTAIGTTSVTNATAASYNNTTGNITVGFDNGISLILVAITIWILALAISALLILRGRQE